MKCWYSAFDAQGSSGLSIAVVQLGAVKIYVAALKRKDKMKLSLPPKLMVIGVSSPVGC